MVYFLPVIVILGPDDVHDYHLSVTRRSISGRFVAKPDKKLAHAARPRSQRTEIRERTSSLRVVRQQDRFHEGFLFSPVTIKKIHHTRVHHTEQNKIVFRMLSIGVAES